MDKLENPVWHCLNETHSGVSVLYGNLKCYRPDVCPFGAFYGMDSVADQVDQYASTIDNFFIVGRKPSVSNLVTLKNELVCFQMVIHQNIDIAIAEEIRKLNGKYENEVYALINRVQPGYFSKNTMEMGEYCGIFKDGNLVAVTGERMKMIGGSEVSAVVTHPNYTGRGYAKQLVADRVNKIHAQNKIPFLHVAKSNVKAMHLYLKLGFEITRKISFWNFVSESDKNL